MKNSFIQVDEVESRGPFDLKCCVSVGIGEDESGSGKLTGNRLNECRIQTQGCERLNRGFSASIRADTGKECDFMPKPMRRHREIERSSTEELLIANYVPQQLPDTQYAHCISSPANLY